ncbi:MAG TPA: TonB-dependent receptor [Terriglobales bacterium]|nr:TonB-dependent receptor [Terriglobales bacterium]
MTYSDLFHTSPEVCVESKTGARLGTAFVCLCFFLMLFAVAPPANAQLYAGSVTGVVNDPSGAVVAAAEVTLTDIEKGFTFKAKTDGNGRYLFRSIPPGVYNLSVNAWGFKEQTKSAVKLDVNQNVSADFSMVMVGTIETVNVSTEAPILASQDAVTGQVVDRKFINDLPTNGRNVWDLAFLAPGVTEVDAACAGCTANNFISNGTRNATADILMDGVTTTNYEQNSGIRVDTYTPSIDAVEEFKVQETNFSAEFGFTGATILNMVTRSGTNSFHGSAYEFLRHYKLDANNWFNDNQGIPIPALRKNNFGGTIGGPIFKNKTFFFFDYEGLRDTSQAGPYFYGVPSAAERSGDFSELCGYAGGTFDENGLCSSPAGQLWDPYAGTYDPNIPGARRDQTAFIPNNNLAAYDSTVDDHHPGNEILAEDPAAAPYRLPLGPGNLIDPVAQKLMSYFPLPNYRVGTPGYSQYINRVDSGSQKGRNDQWDLKIDHRFSEKNLLSGKYSHESSRTDPFNCFGNFADPCSYGVILGGAHMLAINDAHTFNPTTLLTVSYGLSRGTNSYAGAASEFKNISPVDELGEPSYMKDSGYNWAPAVSIAGGYGVAGAYSIGANPWGYARLGQETHQLIGTFSLVRGKHDLKFGAEGRLHRLNYTQPNYAPSGTYYFDQTGTSNYDPACDPSDPDNPCVPLGGDGMASFLIGVQPNSWGQYEIPNTVASQNFEAAGFVQDNWKVSEKLTLNLGMRYEVVMPRTERNNELNWLDPNAESPITLDGAHLKGGERFASSSDRYSYSPDYKNFQPRVGMAFRPFHNTVFRGGYGIYFSAWRGAVAGTSGVGQQGFDQVTQLRTSHWGDTVTPAARMSNPYPNGPIKPPGSSLGLMNDVGYGAYGPIRNISDKVPYEQSWSFGIQQETRWNMVIDLNYIGKKGTHLYFANAGNYSHLGSWVESIPITSPDPNDPCATMTIECLNTYIDSPFADPTRSNFLSINQDPDNPLQWGMPYYQMLMDHPQFYGFAGDEPPIADSIYNALQVRAEKRFSHGLEFLATYTWSKSIDDASLTSTNNVWLGSFASLQNPNNPGLERSLSTFDIPQVLQFSYTHELPVGRGKALAGNISPVMNGFIGGWRTNGIWRFNSGRPIQPGLYTGTSLPTYGPQRPNLIGTPHRAGGKDSDWIQHYFTTTDGSDFLAQPAPYTVGNAPRMLGKVRDPGANNADLSIFKEFGLSKIREAMRLEYRLESFNTFNHPQFCPPDVTFVDPSLGIDPANTNFGKIYYTCNAPRQVQMALKFYW